MVLLGSSLSADYDVSAALRHVKGNIYCYYSPNDAVLAGPMKVFGTIDGKLLVDGAGAIGLHPPGDKSRIVNIRWRPEFARLGYSGRTRGQHGPVVCAPAPRAASPGLAFHEPAEQRRRALVGGPARDGSPIAGRPTG